MKRNWKPVRLALLAALALMLTLAAGCAGGQSGAAQPSDGAAVSGEQEPGPALSADSPEETPGTVKPEDREPEGSEPAASEDPKQEAIEPVDPKQEESEPEDPKPEEVTPVDTKPEDPKPADPEETAPAAALLEDGTYTVDVTLAGGSGRASVGSPAALRVENGAVWATITWSSSNYDYMKVDGEKYLPLSLEGGSVFEIPVASFDCDLPVVADTVAMSTPHEVEYTLRFDSASIQSAS